MLDVTGLCAWYGHVQALKGVDIRVRQGEWVTIVGANGAGKSTLLWAISGLLERKGSIVFDGTETRRASTMDIVRRGIVQVPQGRQLFSDLTVDENLWLGAYCRRSRTQRGAVAADRERVLALFPEVAQRLSQKAGTLSGGEQQMVAIGRALMGAPRLLLLDEPSTGLAPKVVVRIFDALGRLNDEGLSILLVEQDAQLALERAARGYVLATGTVALSGGGYELAGTDEVREIYLGKRTGRPPS